VQVNRKQNKLKVASFAPTNYLNIYCVLQENTKKIAVNIKKLVASKTVYIAKFVKNKQCPTTTSCSPKMLYIHVVGELGVVAKLLTHDWKVVRSKLPHTHGKRKPCPARLSDRVTDKNRLSLALGPCSHHFWLNIIRSFILKMCHKK
jgi:hypothetical protein